MTDARPHSRALRRITGDVRVRILASYVLLLLIAALVSVLVVRQVLLVRLDDRIEDDLVQEVQEFRSLAGGTDPETGKPFGANARRIFSVYLERNVPGEGEQLLTIPRRGPPDRNTTEQANVDFSDSQITRWRELRRTERGEIETLAGEARYVALPLVVEGQTVGTFVVAFFVEGEREEVNEAVRIVALVAAGVLLLGTAFAFAASGRVLSPLSNLRDAALGVSGSNLRRRIEVEGEDDLADLGRSFNAMLDRLESAFASQRDFIRDISHELRTPIAVARGHIELLSEGTAVEPGERAATMTLIAGELDRMSRFVDDLLLLAKSEQPDFLQLETIGLEDFVDELIASGRALADREWTSATASRRSIVGDRQRLSQAMMNLVRNAVEHTAEGELVEIGADVEGADARLWVRDSGPGIPRAEQTRIFDRFARGHASRKRYEGSGLGLAIVRAIAEAHGGRAEVESTPGEGAEFRVIVPVEGPDDPGPPGASAP